MTAIPFLLTLGPNTHAIDAGSLDRVVRQSMDHVSAPGVSVAIVTRDGSELVKGYGLASRERNIGVDENTLFQIGSCTKILTSTLTLKLRDAGRLSLDDPILKHLGSGTKISPHTGPEITIRHLLTHSSGLPGNPINRVDKDGVMQPYSREDLLQGLEQSQRYFPAGSAWAYSNMGYGVLGRVLEKAAGKDYETLLKEELLAPLGMSDTSIHLSPARLQRLATHYWPEDSPQVPRPRWEFGEVSAFGGVVSSAKDMASFLRFQLRPDEKVLSRTSLEEARLPQRHFFRRDFSMGLGWWIRKDAEYGDIFEHGGEVDGHSSFMAICPSDGVGVAVLVNLGGAASDVIGHAVLMEALQQARSKRSVTEQMAVGFYEEGDWGSAAWAYGKLLNGTPENQTFRLRLGLSQVRNGRFQEAFSSLSELLKVRPNDATVLANLARASGGLGRAQEAEQFMAKALQAGYSPFAVREQAWSRQLWNSQAVQSAVAKSAELGSIKSEIALAVARFDWDKALSKCISLRQASADPIEADLLAYGILHAHKKDYPAAYKFARSLIEGSLKSDAERLNAVAWSIVNPEAKPQVMDLPLALSAAAKAVELSDRKDWAILDTLARVHFLQGDKAAARAVLSEAIALAPDRAKAALGETLKLYGG
jgi:CubicO group peptidase (beta-lactamase class C family)